MSFFYKYIIVWYKSETKYLLCIVESGIVGTNEVGGSHFNYWANMDLSFNRFLTTIHIVD